jgi:hypothetical protein
MVKITSISFNNAIYNIDNNRYKKCIIKNCEDDGIYFLSCSSIYKTGLFCKSCRTELEEYGLVDFSLSNSSTKKEQPQVGDI